MRPSVHVFQLYRTTGEEYVWWRYISPNGRSVARCTAPLTSLAEARASIETVRTQHEDAEIAVRPTAAHRWRWTLVREGEVIARGSGDHDRRVRCESAAERFLETVPTAEIDPVVHVFRRRDIAGRLPEAIG